MTPQPYFDPPLVYQCLRNSQIYYSEKLYTLNVGTIIVRLFGPTDFSGWSYKLTPVRLDGFSYEILNASL